MEDLMKLYDSDASLMPPKMIKYLLQVQGPYSKEFYNDGVSSFGNLYGSIVFAGQSMVFLLNDPIFLFIVFYIITSFLGYFASKIYYCLLLFDIIRRSVVL